MITLITAVSENSIIGDSKLDKMPWYCSEELQHFKSTTMGGTLVMGRKTAEQVGKLPGRDAIVITNQPDYQLDGFYAMNIHGFLHNIDREKHYYICGGAEIYSQLSKYCEDMIISYMKFEVNGDVKLPYLNKEHYYTAEVKHFEKFVVFHYKKFKTIT